MLRLTSVKYVEMDAYLCIFRDVLQYKYDLFMAMESCFLISCVLDAEPKVKFGIYNKIPRNREFLF